MINLKMHEEKWRIIIGDEIWQFDNLAEMKKNLILILDIKNKYGNIIKNDRK